MEIKANNPKLKSWIAVKPNSDFPIQNIPFGIGQTKTSKPFVCSIIGENIINVAAVNQLGYLNDLNIDQSKLENNFLNDFISLGKSKTNAVREKISELFQESNTTLSSNKEHCAKILLNVNEVALLMPVHVGDYTDFYSSIDHATNIGKMIRDPANALMPNWKHIPVGYHGRASSIRVSGHSFHRPKGQTKPADAEVPVFGACKLLDFEVETAFIIGKSTELGDSISTEKADEYIFGMTLFNDWSARDIQTWEYVPLGPFLAKNFASTTSPWIVTLEALEPFRVSGYKQDPKVLPYLEFSGDRNLSIQLEMFIQPKGAEASLVCSTNYKFMYWTMEQQLAHHTVNGCNMNVGDMLASGTISGPEEHQFGSMMELSWKGTKTVKLKDGSERKFINDYDTVILKGWSEKDGIRVGFGECAAMVLPAK